MLYAGPSQNIRFLETKPNAIEHQLGLEVTRSNLDKLKDAVSYVVFNSKIFCLYILWQTTKHGNCNILNFYFLPVTFRLWVKDKV